MSDKEICYTPTQNVQIDTGAGHMPGVIATSTSATPGAVTIYDYAGAGPPTGPKIFQAVVSSAAPLICLFNDRFAPRFKDGLWLISTDVYLIIWYHMPKV